MLRQGAKRAWNPDRQAKCRVILFRVQPELASISESALLTKRVHMRKELDSSYFFALSGRNRIDNGQYQQQQHVRHIYIYMFNGAECKDVGINNGINNGWLMC